MTDDKLRPEVVAALTDPQPLPAALVDQALDASDAEREAAAGELLDRTRALLEQTGVLRPSRSVLDLQFVQVQYLVAAYGLLAPWGNQPGWEAHSFRNLLKVVPGDIAEAAGRLLAWGGFIPLEPGQ